MLDFMLETPWNAGPDICLWLLISCSPWEKQACLYTQGRPGLSSWLLALVQPKLAAVGI